MGNSTKVYVRPDQRYFKLMPWSEACAHLKVAGRRIPFEVVGEGEGPPMVQLYCWDGSPFSFPITTGEAGLYDDEGGLYFYEERG